MSSRGKEYIDRVIRETIRRQMQEAGEPRPELLWKEIQRSIADRKRGGGGRSLLARLALFKWQAAGAAVVVCLLAVTAFFPGQLTALGKRALPGIPFVQKADEARPQVAGSHPAPEKVRRAQTMEETAVSPVPAAPAAEAPPVEIADPAAQPGKQPGAAVAPERPAPASRPVGDGAEARARSAHPMAATRQSDPARDTVPADDSARIFTVASPENEESALRRVRRTAPFPVRYPTYLPSGFREDNIQYRVVSEQRGEVRATFARPDKEAVISLTQQNAANGKGYGAAGRGPGPESAPAQSVQIKGHKGTLVVTKCERGPCTELGWFDGHMRYQIRGEAEPEEIIKMAESLQP